MRKNAQEAGTEKADETIEKLSQKSSELTTVNLKYVGRPACLDLQLTFLPFSTNHSQFSIQEPRPLLNDRT